MAAFCIVQIRVAFEPFVITLGKIDTVQIGSGNAGGRIELVTTVSHDVVHPLLLTESVYRVVILSGGMMLCEPERGTIIFPGFITPVFALTLLHERTVPEPFTTTEGFDDILQNGGGIGGSGVVTTGTEQEFDPAPLETIML